jgi:hypothetical protein
VRDLFDLCRADFDRSRPDKDDGTVKGQYFVICDHFGATTHKKTGCD